MFGNSRRIIGVDKMKDLDFDELDRAVNSLISGEPGSVSGGNSSSDVNNTTSSTSAQRLVDDQTTVSSTIKPTPPIEKPATGRFMDVVHPSSDMRTSSLVMPERTSSLGMSSPVTTSPLVPTPAIFPMKTDKSATESPSFSGQSNPIDFSAMNDNSAVSADKDEDADIDRISNDIDNTINRTSDEPLDSPFLSGAKVEKRPLGTFSAEPTVTPTPVTASETVAAPSSPSPFWPVKPSTPSETTDPEIKMPTDITPAAPPLPAELQDDLLSIESDTLAQPVKPSVVPPIISNSSTPISTTTALTAAAATSIPQQYTEQPNSGNKDNGAIFDTKSYHKAMVRPTKKKSGWMLVVWIAILLVVGIGAGVAVYLFVLPRL